MDWVILHWQEIFNVVVAIVAAAKLGAKITPGEVDDNVVGRAIKVLDVIGMVGNKTQINVKKRF